MQNPTFSDTDDAPRIVSFDFESTLLLFRFDEDFGLAEAGPNQPMLSRLRTHLAKGDTVWIVTTRRPSQADRVHTFLATHKLKVAGVRFTAGVLKVDTLLDLGVTLHHDDDPEELAHLPDSIESVLAPIHPSWDHR